MATYYNPLKNNKNYSDNSLDVTDEFAKFRGKSLQYILKNRNNKPLYTGYDYRGKIFKNSLSRLIFFDKKRENIIQKIDEIWWQLIQKIKIIKKTFNYTVNKDYIDFN